MEDRERPERATEVATERRRRSGGGLVRSLNLQVPDQIREKLAKDGRTPRWVNDTKNRIADLTERDDYDKVQGVDPVRVGVGEDGKPIFAHLLSKPDAFIAEDRAKAEQRRRETEAGMVKGKVPVPGADAQPVQGQGGAEVYADAANKIGRANQILD